MITYIKCVTANYRSVLTAPAEAERSVMTSSAKEKCYSELGAATAPATAF